MSDSNDSVLDAIRRRSAKRRDVLKYAGQATAVAGGLTLLSACGDDDALFGTPNPPAPATPTPTPAPAPTSTPGVPTADIGVLNFLLNLAYLQAALYLSLGTDGAILDGADISGTGTLGTISVPNKAVALTTKDVPSFAQSFAREVGQDSVLRLRAIRAVLGSQAVAAPSIDVTGATFKPYGTAALAFAPSGTAALSNYTPNSGGPAFISSTTLVNSIVLSSFLGAIPKVTSTTALNLLFGCIESLSYHHGHFRTAADLQSQIAAASKGAANGQIVWTRAYSAYADSLDGTTDLDQGPYITDGDAANGGGNSDLAANVVEADANALALTRTPAQALSVLYQNGTAGTTSGGFFPVGINQTQGSATIYVSGQS